MCDHTAIEAVIEQFAPRSYLLLGEQKPLSHRTVIIGCPIWHKGQTVGLFDPLFQMHQRRLGKGGNARVAMATVDQVPNDL